MNSLSTDAAALAQWPTAERVRALKRIIPRAKVQEALRRTGHARRRYLRLPAWFHGLVRDCPRLVLSR